VGFLYRWVKGGPVERFSGRWWNGAEWLLAFVGMRGRICSDFGDRVRRGRRLMDGGQASGQRLALSVRCRTDF